MNDNLKLALDILKLLLDRKVKKEEKKEREKNYIVKKNKKKQVTNQILGFITR